MHAPSLRTLFAAGGLLVGGTVVGLTAIIPAHAISHQSTMSRTLHLVEKGGGLKIVDNPPKAKHQYDFSAGDIVIVTRDLFNPNGDRAGSLRLVCVATDAHAQQCNGTETLAAGTLELAGISAPARSTLVAVTGGTGAYNGARGTSVSMDRKGSADIAEQTVTLLR